jgi:DNA repair protein RecO
MRDIHFIILNKQEILGNKQIINVLTDSYGRLTLVYRSNKKSCLLDYFKVYFGTIREPSHSEMSNLNSCELISEFNNIPLNYKKFREGFEIIKFLLDNTITNTGNDILFTSLKKCLSNLNNVAEVTTEHISLMKLIFLYQEGLLPNNLSSTNSSVSESQKKQQMKELLKYALVWENRPNFSDAFWNSFSAWINAICKINNLKLTEN